MTQEEKAKAYDAALETAKQVISDNCTEVEKICLECVFPQLRESEDEKIRKVLIGIVKGACNKYGIKYTGDEISEEKLLSYLEKQKENPKSTDSIPSDCASDAKCENEHNEEGDFVFELRQIISSHRYSDIYGEYINDEEGMASEILELCKCELEKQKEPDGTWTEEDDAKVNAMCKEGDLKPSEIAWLKELKNRIVKKEQKSAEWSAEDERMLRLIINAFKEGAMSTIKQDQWLKSLPERFNLQPQAQPEQKPEVKQTRWVARDENGEIYAFEDYPEKDSEMWIGSNSMLLDRKSFPDLKWEDEPVEVEITIKKK